MTNFRELRRVYGFDEVAIAPGSVTVNPEMVNTEFSVGNVTTDIPVLGSAMDAVASPAFAGEMHRQGALSVMNLEGVQTRYDNPQEAIEEIAAASRENVNDSSKSLVGFFSKSFWSIFETLKGLLSSILKVLQSVLTL